MTTWTELSLAENHRDKLITSAVSPDVAELRGYYTETSRRGLAALGFADYQCLTPALVIPFINPTGKRTGYQIKPDKPRLKENGKPLKYETPAGSVGVVNCGPFTSDNCASADYPLIITEGAIKADALESHGFNALSLAGVFNYSYRVDNVPRPLPDWDLIVLDGRRVGIAFDYPDIHDNDKVQLAALRLQAFLNGRGARTVLLDVNKAVSRSEYGR